MRSKDIKKLNNKIERIFAKLLKRLPKRHHYKLKTYGTVYALIKAEARNQNKSYKSLVKEYEISLKTECRDYIDTKYYDVSDKSNRRDAYQVKALSGDPICVAVDNFADVSICGIAFVLLHEMAHNYYGIKKGDSTETEADAFAIRWCRKLIKEGIISPPTINKRRLKYW